MLAFLKFMITFKINKYVRSLFSKKFFCGAFLKKFIINYFEILIKFILILMKIIGIDNLYFALSYS